MINDLSGIGRANFDMDLFKVMLPISENDIQRCHKVYCFNSSWFVKLTWGCIKHFWTEESRERYVFADNAQ